MGCKHTGRLCRNLIREIPLRASLYIFLPAKLNALISEGKAKVLAKPNVVTMNGRKAEILIGSKIPVIVEHLENGVQTTATEYKDAGIKLTYTPLISRKTK